MTGTGTSRGTTAAAALALGLALVGCGATSRPSPPSAFAWLKPGPAPSAWPTLRIENGARLAYPPSWRRIHGDRGTATVVLRDASGRFRGYLNLTPRQGAETISGWPRFRVDHNRDEGDRQIRKLAGAGGLAFRDGHGSCVRDQYVTSTGDGYVEVACLVLGARSADVVVAAAPPADWRALGPLLERSVDSLIV